MDGTGSVCGGWCGRRLCVALRGDAPLSPELTAGANGDEVDWMLLPPPGIVLRGGNERWVALGDALLTASRGNKNTA